MAKDYANQNGAGEEESSAVGGRRRRGEKKTRMILRVEYWIMSVGAWKERVM